jgi:ABC-2 type transport system ATP-binding protein
VSKAIFFAFAGRQKALLEMSLKKANLEDIFIELTKEDEQS